MATKWSILTERLADLEKRAEDLRREMEGMENTKCGILCVTCQTMLETEADFAKHFTIPDSRYLNLGDCPHRGEWREATNEETQDYLSGYRFYDKREWRETDNGLEVKVD